MASGSVLPPATLHASSPPADKQADEAAIAELALNGLSRAQALAALKDCGGDANKARWWGGRWGLPMLVLVHSVGGRQRE